MTTTTMGLAEAPQDRPFLALVQSRAGRHWMLARRQGGGIEAAALDGTPPGDIVGWAPLPPLGTD